MFWNFRYRRAFACAAAAALVCLVTCASLEAQTTSASVSGTVKDAQGAVLPGASVTLTSIAQGTVQTMVTDGLGNFLFAYVQARPLHPQDQHWTASRAHTGWHGRQRA